MDLVLRDPYAASPVSSSVIRVVDVTKPKGAKGTGKKTAKTTKAAGAYLTFVDGAFVAHSRTKKAAAAVPTKRPLAVVPPPPAAPKVKKPKHELTFTAMGPGKAVGISCNGKELLAEVVFQESFSLGDSCIRVDGHVVHKYKVTDKIAVGGMTARSLMNLH